MTEAASDLGKARAGVNLPPLPDDCRVKEAHAAVTESAEVRSILIRERAALDRQNTRTDRCAGFYDETRTRFAGSQ
ncbi:hypothetical protein HW571_25045 [Agrobacterium genomosp. 3]|nr:hypothetical protein [Agrobacterium tomkonis]MCA1879324.1 hypothetical protein [Agrobacterium tumefaciens]MCA1894487.1 hypothetical protein [Agrobacterium tomkonis]